MNIRREDAETLVKVMVAIAEAVVSDQEYRHSDYTGMDTRRASEKAIETLSKLEPGESTPAAEPEDV